MLNSLRKRFYALLLVPVALLLSGFGYLGFAHFHQILFNEWQATAMVRLEHAALQLELRLDKFRQWFQLFNQSRLSAHSEQVQSWFLQQIRDQEGVEAVQIVWEDRQPPSQLQPLGENWLAGRSLSLSPVRFKTVREGKAVILESNLLNQAGQSVGHLEVVVSWARILQGLFGSAWFPDHDTIIMDENRQLLFHSNPVQQERRFLGETGDSLELAVLNDLAKKSSGIILGEGSAAQTVAGYFRLPQTPWVLILFAQKQKVLAPVQRFQFYYLTAGIICLFAILAFIRQLICPIIMSIREISRATLQVAEGHYGQPLPEERRDELGQLTHNFNIMVAGLKERDYIKDTFGRYVDPEVAQELLRRPEASLLGGERRFVAILFADLREFTPVAETLSPEATISLVNRFFSRMVEVIRRYKGIIVDFYGDGLLAFFEPLREEELGDCIARGQRCALEMQVAMEELNFSNQRQGYPALQLGIGLHAGEAVVGNIGSETRAKYGIVGSAVNLTHRIQSQAQGGEVVLSSAAYERITPPPPRLRTFQAALKGVRGEITLSVIAPDKNRLSDVSKPS